MLKAVNELLTALNKKKINYCLWKSNNKLKQALNGKGDLDFLIDAGQRNNFKALLKALRFKQSLSPNWKSEPFIFHYFGLDENTGIIIHLHVFYALITGGSQYKNYALKLEKLFFQNTEFYSPVKIPVKEIEIIVFVIRKYLEHASIIELYLVQKEIENIYDEFKWLHARADKNKIKQILQEYFPQLKFSLFQICCDKLLNKSSIFSRVILGFRIKKLFRDSVIHSRFKASILRGLIFAFAILSKKTNKFIDIHKRFLSARGLIIAFVGTEVSGKTSIVNHIYNWLNPEFKAYAIHCGKPPATAITIIPRLLIRMYVSIKRKLKFSIKIANPASLKNKSEVVNLPHPIISLLDALERYRLLKRFFRVSLKGYIVLTDRYPSTGEDSVDCQRIKGDNFILRIMSKMEKKLYSSIPRPNILFKINAPLSLTLKRNSKRLNPEPKEFIQERYRLFRNIEFKDVPIYNVDNSGKVNAALFKIKRIIWDHLSGS